MSFGLRNVNEPKKALRELLRVTKPGGRLVVCEFSHPPSRDLQRALPLLQRPGAARRGEDRELQRRGVRLPQRVDPRLARPAHAGGVDPRSGLDGRRPPQPLDRASSRCTGDEAADAATAATTRPPIGRGPDGAPVGWACDTLSAGLPTRGQAGPHRPHLRRSAIAQAAHDASRQASKRVDSALERELRVADALADATSRYLYDAGGKRVRPMLALLTAQLGDGATDAVIDGATALEMTHLGSLYHDDVMDAADKRRGVPSAHAVWGNNVAILTGDLLFSRASQIMARHGDRAIRLQADTFERLVLGQMHETVGPAEADDRVDVLPAGALRQDRLADRGRRAVGRDLLRTGPQEFEGPDGDLRREGRGRLPAARRRHRPVRRPRRDRQGARHRPARRRADHARTSCSGERDGCGIRRAARPHRRRRRPHRRRRRSLDPRRAARASCAITRRPRPPSTSPTRGRARRSTALAPLPDGAVREALTRFAQAVADRSS